MFPKKTNADVAKDEIDIKPEFEPVRLHLEVLEQRLLFSADIPVLASIDAGSDETLDTDNLYSFRTNTPAANLTHNTAALSSDAVDAETETFLIDILQPTVELIFIDNSVSDIARLHADLAIQQDNGRTLEIINISAQQDGIAQISEHLQSHTDVSAIHIVSHGTQSGVAIGSSWLDNDSVEGYSTQLAGWQSALSADADILLYGCDLAADPQGIALLEKIASATGADIAASNDTTGHTILDGNWDLEYDSGQIDAQALFSAALQANWTNQLAVDLQADDHDFGEVLINSTIPLNDPGSSATNILNGATSSDPGIRIVSVEQPVSGTITNNSGNYTYVAATGYTGADTFDYVITDNNTPIVTHYPLNTAAIVDSTGASTPVDTPVQNQPTFNGTDYDFDGDDHIELPDIDYSQTFTISINFTVGNLVPGKQFLYQHGSGISENSLQIWIDGNELYFSFSDSNEVVADILPPSVQIAQDGLLHNVTITHEPGQGFETYVDGVDIDIYSTITRGGDFIDPVGPIYIGNDFNNNPAENNGLDTHKVTDVRIYNDVQTSLETSRNVDYSTGTVSLTLRDMNQAPVFTSLDNSPLYTENDTPVVLDDNVTITDDQLTAIDNFNGSSLLLQRATGADAEDVFSNSGLLAPLTEGQSLSYNDPLNGSTTIGTVVTNTGGTLELDFDIGATNDLVNKVIQEISYSNTSESPPPLVDIEWTFRDGFSDSAVFGTELTDTGTTTVQITEVPDIVVVVPNSVVQTNEDTPFLIVNGISVSHDQPPATPFRVELSVADGTLTATANPSVVTYGDNTSKLILEGPQTEINTALQTVTYTPNPHYNGTDSMVVTGSFDTGKVVHNSFEGADIGTLSTVTYNGELRNGAMIVTDPIRGQVLELVNDGSDQHLLIPGNAGQPSEVTLSAWVNLNSPDTTGSELISLGDNIGLRLDTIPTAETTRYGLIGFYNDSNAPLWLETRALTGTSVAGSGWHHVAYTVAPNSQKLFLDGVNISETFHNGDLTYSHHTDGVVGKHGNGVSNYAFDGRIDDIKVFNSALSATEVQSVSLSPQVSASVSIAIDSENDAPIFSNAGNISSYDIAAGSPVPIDNDITINDIELETSGNYNNTTLTLNRIDSVDYAPSPQSAANSTDRFSSSIQPGNLAAGSTLVDGTVAFGTVSQNSGGMLSLTFDTNADKQKIDGLIQSILYENTSNWPPDSTSWPHDSVELQWSFNDYGVDNDGSADTNTAVTSVSTSTIDITATSSQPTRLVNKELVINVGSVDQVVDIGYLGYVDLDTPDASLLYEITNKPVTAVIKVNGAPLAIGDTFSQAEINQGIVTASSTLTSTGFEDIELEVQGNSAISNDTFRVRVIDDVPSDLQSGIRLNLDANGGDDAFLGDVDGFQFMDGPDNFSFEFTFSQLQKNSGDQETTLYSGVSTGQPYPGHHEHLVIVPVPGTNDGILQWDTALYNPQAGTPSISATLPDVFDGGIHSVALTFGMDVGERIKLYYDGNLVGDESNNYPGDAYWSGGFPWVIGQQLELGSELSSPYSFDNFQFTQGKHFSGVLHEVRVWDQIRTATQIDENRHARISGAVVPGLLVDWHMHDPDGTPNVSTVVDNTPNPGATNQQPVLQVGHAYKAGNGFTPSTPTDELVIDDNAANNTVIGYVLPEDPAPDIGGYKYEVVQSGQPSPFVIDMDTGRITLQDNSLLAENLPHYDVIVRVTSTNVSGATVTDEITVKINAINDPPVIHPATNPVINFTEGGTPVLVNDSITVTDDELEATSFAGSILTLERIHPTTSLADPQPQDQFSSDLFAAPSTSYTVDQTNERLQITFNNGATVAGVNALLQSIKYENISHNPATNVELLWIFNDGNVALQGSGGPQTAKLITTVAITPINDPPVLNTLPNPFSTTLEDTVKTITFSDLEPFSTDILDGTVDSFIINQVLSGTLSVGGSLATASSSNTTIDAANSAFWTPPLHTPGLFDAFEVYAVDNLGLQSADARIIKIQVDDVSYEPEGSDTTITAFEDTPQQLSTAHFGFSDNDSNAFDSVQINQVNNGVIHVSGNPLATTHISVSDLTSSQVFFHPTANLSDVSGEIFFQVVDDGTNNTDSTENLLSISIQQVNDPPSGQSSVSPIIVVEDGYRPLNQTDFGFSDTIDVTSTRPTGNAPYSVIFDTVPANGSVQIGGIPLAAGDYVLYSELATGLEYWPAPNDTTPAHIDFRLRDDGGIANGGKDTSATANRIDFEISAINDAPVANNFSIDVPENTVHTFDTLEFGFNDPHDGHTLDTLHVLSLPNDGTLTLLGTAISAGATIDASDIAIGSLKYEPPANTNGNVSSTFAFKVQDNGGAPGVDTSTNTYTATIVNLGINQPPVANPAGPVSVVEDTNYDLKPSDFGFTDSDGHNLQNVIIDSTPVLGSLLYNNAPIATQTTVSATDIANKLLVYQPIAHATGTDSFVYRLQDDGGVHNGGFDTTASAHTLVLDISHVNDAPVAADFSIDVPENSVHIFTTLEFGFNDPYDGHAFDTLHVLSLPNDGTLTLLGTAISAGATFDASDIAIGSLKYEPPANTNGNVSSTFTFQVQDDGDAPGVDTSTNTYTATIVNQGINQPPVANPAGPVSVVEDTNYGLKLSDFGFTDSDGHNFQNIIIDSVPVFGSLTLGSVPVSAQATVSVADIANGQLVFHPMANSSLADSFVYRLQDDGGTLNGGYDTSYASHMLVLDISDVNDAPVAGSFSINVTENSVHTFNTSEFGFDDPLDGHAFDSLHVLSLPADGTLKLLGTAIVAGTTVDASDIASGFLKYEPPANTNGNVSSTFTFKVQDNGGTTLGVDTSANTYIATIVNQGINQPPVASPAPVTVVEDNNYVVQQSDFGFADTDGHNLQNVIIDFPPVFGSLTLNGVPVTPQTTVSATAIANELLVFHPKLNSTLADSFGYRLQDDGGTLNGGYDTTYSSHILAINISAVNDAPVGGNFSIDVLENSVHTFNTAEFGFNDPQDGHAFDSLHVMSLPDDGTLQVNGSAIGSGTTVAASEIAAGLLIYEPPANTTGNATTTFTFKVQDSGGTSPGINVSADHYTATINNIGVNNPPVISNNLSVVLGQDTPYLLKKSDFGFQDVENHHLESLIIDSLPSLGILIHNGVPATTGSAISASDIDDGLLVFNPEPGEFGTQYTQLDFRVQDNGGTLNGGNNTSVNSKSLNFDVTEFNSPPSARDFSTTVFEDSSYTFQTSDFSFIDAIENHAFAALHVLSLPSAGSLVLSGNSVTANSIISVNDIENSLFTYIPPTDTEVGFQATSNTSFTFAVQDTGGTANGGADISTVAKTVYITNNGLNDPPVINSNQVLSTAEDTPLVFRQSDFSFTDPENNKLFAVIIESLPATGTLQFAGQSVVPGMYVTVSDLDDGKLVYLPGNNYHGTTELSVRVQDDGGTMHSGQNTSVSDQTIAIEVIPVNDAPQAVNDEFSVAESATYDSAQNQNISVTDNDTDIDVDGPVEVTLLTPPQFGALTLNQDGTFVYQHNGSENTQDSFTYNISDGQLIDEATVNIIVIPVNDTPQAGTADEYTTQVNSTFTLPLPETLFTDPDPSDTLVFSLVNTPDTPAPPWIEFDDNAFILSGAPTETGLFVVRLVAEDNELATAFTDIHINVVTALVPPLAALNPEPSPEIVFGSVQTSQIGTATQLGIATSNSNALATEAGTRSEQERSNSISNVALGLQVPDVEPYRNTHVFKSVPTAQHYKAPLDVVLANQINVAEIQQILPLEDLINLVDVPHKALTSLAGHLDQSKSELGKTSKVNFQVLSGAATVSAGLSIGYVIWLIRGGVLMGSVLSSLPAWRWIDPLPVLSGSTYSSSDAQDESLEEMVGEEENSNEINSADTGGSVKENSIKNTTGQTKEK